MKELTTEQKAQRYDETLEKAKDFYKGYKQRDNQLYADDLESIFPELKESENEKTKRLLHTIANKMSQHLRDIFTEEEFQCFDAWSNAWLEKQGEQKLAVNTKVNTPKFKVGDWVVFNNKHESIYQIEKIENFQYTLRHMLGGSMPLSFSHEDMLRLWTIDDARDGDVLVSPSTPEGDKECPFIFKEIDKNGIVRFHAALLQNKHLEISDDITNVMGYSNAKYHIPATIKQRNTLLETMFKAGYTFDLKKGLKYSKYKYS